MYAFYKSKVHCRTNFKQKQKLETSFVLLCFDIIFAIETLFLFVTTSMFLHKVKALTHISQRMHEVIPPLCLQKPIHCRKWKMGANQRWNFCRNLTHFPLFFTLTKSTPPFWNSCPLSWKLNTMQKWNYIKNLAKLEMVKNIHLKV